MAASLTTAMAMLFGASSADSQELRELVQLGLPSIEAELEAIEADGTLQMRDGDGAVLEVSAGALVRWSTPPELRSSDALLLADGSVITLAPAWGGRSSFTFDGAAGEARTRRLGRISLERASATALLLKLPSDGIRIAAVIDKVRSMQDDIGVDQLLLDNGDVVSGKLLRIGGSEADAPNQVSFEANFGPVELPRERIRAVIFANGTTEPEPEPTAQPRLLIGLDDGSLIAAAALATADGELSIRSPLLGPLRIGGIERVAFVQSLGGRVAYLSDLEPASYRHEPYLELPWKYRRNRNVLGQPLRASDRTYLKGLGMHSKSRLTYDLDGSHEWFAAAVAIDDAAEAGGSVIFRVRLAKDGQWHEAWSSGVVRGGGAPRPVRVELEGAEQLELTVDYADRGAERDYANWLDARLERK